MYVKLLDEQLQVLGRSRQSPGFGACERVAPGARRTQRPEDVSYGQYSMCSRLQTVGIWAWDDVWWLSFFSRLGVGGQSYSNFLASTVRDYLGTI